MTVEQFRVRLAAAKSPQEIERLLGQWFAVTGTFEELCALRDETVARWDALLDAEGGGRGAVNAELVA